MTRRTLLRAVGLSVLASAGGLDTLLPALAQTRGADVGRLIVRSKTPPDVEPPADLLSSWITPNEVFFVRSHLPPANVDVRAWTLTVDGNVARPLTLNLDDLKALPPVTSVITLECAGNGRAFFDPPVAGVQWRKGAVGTARWTGVRLADVLAKAGVNPGAQFVLFDGADRSIGTVPDFLRTLPIAKATHRDTLLVYEMNGVPLPAAHGFPLRALVPGWEGAYSVKWLTGIRAVDQQHDGFFVQTAYRYPTRPVAPGSVVDARDTEPLTGLEVKSLIASPADASSVPSDRLRIAGFAWAGEANITRVDVSMDGGRTWIEARLRGDRVPYAWRAFDYEWRVSRPGRYELQSRATDDRGRVQPPLTSPWNPSGYLWNAADRVTVSVGKAQSQEADRPTTRSDAWESDAAAPLLHNKCTVCHGTDLISQQRLSEQGWSRELDKMVRWGTSLTDMERSRLLDLLARSFGP